MKAKSPTNWGVLIAGMIFKYTLSPLAVRLWNPSFTLPPIMIY
ncbi:MAG: DUF6783 domain-containing protein [Anaerobutyricum hallii]